MKKIIITESQHNILLEELNTKEDVFQYLKSLPKKFKIQTRYGNYPRKTYSDGLSTALNYNPITKLYLDILRTQKKTTTLMPIPDNMDNTPYDILNNIIKATEKFYVQADRSKSTGFMNNMDPEQQREMENRFVNAIAHRLMSALLYEDYFNVNFRNNLHMEVSKLIIPQSPEDMKKLYKVIEEKDGPINVSLFFGSVIPIVNLIEKDTLM